MDDIEAKREKCRLNSARWRAANAEQHRASVRAWRLANPEKARAKAIRDTQRSKERDRIKREQRLAETADVRAAAEIARAEAKRQKAREYYQANRERTRDIRLEQSRKWRDANPGKSAALQRAWKAKNRERVLADKRSRKASKRIAVVRDLTKLQRGRCAYCRIKLTDELHVDHVMPLKRGGPDKRSNLQLTCAPCNLSKSARHPVEFAQSIGRLL